MTHPSKQSIRKKNIRQRSALPKDVQLAASQAICQHLQHWAPFQHATHIALYQAVHGEIDLKALWHQASLDNKHYYLPRINENLTLSFITTTQGAPCHINRFGIEEPLSPPGDLLLPEKFDMIMLPVVAFDKTGTRLGMGAGYYDRTLTDIQGPLLVGIAYECQREVDLQVDPWDIPLQVIITETGVHWCR